MLRAVLHGIIVIIIAMFSLKGSFAEIQGTLHQWQPMEIHFEGPMSNELANQPNPFLDYRLQVQFTSPEGRQFNVPGFFNGDGQGGGEGNVWTARFTPDTPGEWQYQANFRQGERVAVRIRRFSGETESGKPAAFDGERGSFTIKQYDADAPGFWKRGRLEYIGEHYLRFQDGTYFLKGGCNSPENYLAYADFDNTTASHRYKPHENDWKAGDPSWKNGKGKGIIGTLNYLASMQVNSIYFLTMNIGGDGKDVWPFAGKINPNGHPKNDNLHYDIGKLHQWNTVFEHAQHKGLMLHFVLNESEEKNKLELDDATLGVERKLYYRELIARFGHHNALQWNLSEEFDLFISFGPDRIKEFAQYIQDLDPYDHPITVHNEGRDPDPNWLPFLGDSRISTTSLQHYQNTAKWGERVEKWRQLSEVAGRPLPINMDEFLEANLENSTRIRKEVIWPTYLSGGQLEIILESKLQTEEFRTMESLWAWTAHARTFVEEHLPFWKMSPDDLTVNSANHLEGGAQCFSLYGEVYALYFPVAQNTGNLTMWGVKGMFEQRWFNPRSGRFEGEPIVFEAESERAIGEPPSAPNQDWAVLIRKINSE